MGRGNSGTRQTKAHGRRGQEPAPRRPQVRQPATLPAGETAPAGETESAHLRSAAEAVAGFDERKLAVTVEEAARLLSLNRTKIYTLRMHGELRSFKASRSRRIPMVGIYEYLERVSA
jgi:excisionase family DNA binding protein